MVDGLKHRVRIKMCGMTRAMDVAQAVSLGVDAVGFIFYTKSTRAVSVSDAKPIMDAIPAFVDAVAVFVNPEVSLVQDVISTLPIQYLQFHGDESPAFCEQFGLPYIKAVSATSTASINHSLVEYNGASAILLDTPSELSRGGSGQVFDWGIVPPQASDLLILAGGLDAANVAQAISLCRPYAVDVCSGIEDMPGIKAYEKMKQFVKQVRGTE